MSTIEKVFRPIVIRESQKLKLPDRKDLENILPVRSKFSVVLELLLQYKICLPENTSAPHLLLHNLNTIDLHTVNSSPVQPIPEKNYHG